MKGIYAYYDLHNKYYVYVGKDSNIAHNRRHHEDKRFSCYDEQPFNRILQNNPERYEYHRLIELPDDIPNNFLNDLEFYFIDLFKTYAYENGDKHVFNFTKGGDGTSGYRHTDEARKKMSEAHKGKTISEETRKKMSIVKSGENHPMYGKHHSEETRKKISIVKSGENNPMYGKCGENHPNYGKHFSEETRKKMSIAQSGENHPNAKYSLWDITCVHYNKQTMFQHNREPNPCKCFSLKYGGKDVPMGGFYDFLTVEIINGLIQEAIQNDE